MTQGAEPGKKGGGVGTEGGDVFHFVFVSQNSMLFL